MTYEKQNLQTNLIQWWVLLVDLKKAQTAHSNQQGAVTESWGEMLTHQTC